MNVRCFIARKEGEEDVWWFGGGMDMTPYYGQREDVGHFHRTCRDALSPFGDEVYPKYKQWCDEYFFLKHRSEPRGVGGILFVVLFGNLLAFNLYMTGVKLIGPEKSVLYGFAEPVTAAILAVTLLDTPFTVWDALGFAAVFAMLAVLSVGGKKYAERLEV